MGEILEVSIVSYENDIIEKVMNFMENMFEIHSNIQNIEIMDNWNYQNVFNVTSLDEAKKYMNSKIITLTKTSLTGQIGVSAEHSKKYYCYHFWYNPKYEIPENKYKEIYIILVSYLLDTIKNKILMCVMGREISVDFDLNVDQIIKQSHNIDIWIIKKNIYEKYGLKGMIKTKIILV